jgi:hypothetical protein
VPDDAQTAAVRHDIEVELCQVDVECTVPPNRVLEEKSRSPKPAPTTNIRWSPVVTDALGATWINFGENKQSVAPDGDDIPAAHGWHVLFDPASAAVE